MSDKIGCYKVKVVVTETNSGRTYLMEFRSREEISRADIRKYFCNHYHENTYEYKILDPVYGTHQINLDGDI